MRVGFLVVAAIQFVSGSVFSAELEAVLTAVENAYGGRAAVERLESYRVEGETSSLMRGRVGTVVRQYAAPDRLRVEITYPDAREVRVVTGDGVWRGDGDTMRPVEGPMKEAVLFQLLRSDLPGALLRNRDLLEDGGVMAHEESSHRVIVMPWSDSLSMRYWVHLENKRITLVEGTISAGEHTLNFATAYSDFRSVEGVLFPFAERNFASGRHVANTAIHRLVLNPESSDAALSPKARADRGEKVPTRRIEAEGRLISYGR